ncbi:MAG TPA: hypothetical protein VFS19_05270 [Planctomycetota bacterium]|nr:hypothetical protein [Planctomycetota bacterium]
MTFSDARVAKAVNDKFVATWVNREPGFHNCDSNAERQISQMKSFATKNVCTFFTSPDLDTLHYASGFFRPEQFMEELAAVAELKRGVLDLRNRYMEDALPEFGAIHGKHAKAHELEAGPEDRSSDALHRREGLLHLAAVHKDLAGRAAKVRGPVPLKDVWSTYLFGNGFQETKKVPREGPGRSPGM